MDFKIQYTCSFANVVRFVYWLQTCFLQRKIFFYYFEHDSGDNSVQHLDHMYWNIIFRLYQRLFRLHFQLFSSYSLLLQLAFRASDKICCTEVHYFHMKTFFLINFFKKSDFLHIVLYLFLFYFEEILWLELKWCYTCVS